MVLELSASFCDMTSNEDSNLSQQLEEVEALRAIYGRAWICDSEEARIFRIDVKHDESDQAEGNGFYIRLSVRLPQDYPIEAPPFFELSSPYLNATDKTTLSNSLNDAYVASLGEPVLFQWIEAIRNFEPGLEDAPANNSMGETSLDTTGDDVDTTAEYLASTSLDEDTDIVICPEITSGGAVTDRKSTFQAHVAKVTSKAEVNKVMERLLSNAKIARATHNITAYRIPGQREGVLLQDCVDDGEHGAGQRLLHLLTMMGALNVIVVVSRWYGGIHLGPDRFKHINNVARLSLEAGGFGREAAGSADKKKTAKKKAGRN